MDYVYKAIVKRVYDGDTITVDIDLGFNIWWKDVNLRLYGIDTPEIRGEERPEGLIAKQYVVDRLPIDSAIRIQTFKDKKGKYGRYLATIYYEKSPNMLLQNLNEELVANGLAERYMVSE